MDTTNIRHRVTSNTEHTVMDPLLEPLEIIKDDQKVIHAENAFVVRNRIRWYWAVVFYIFWFILYYGIAVPAFNRLPTPLQIADEANYPQHFIAERAEINLRKLIDLGPRVVGSIANEVLTINYFKEYLERMQSTMLDDIHSMEVDVQLTTGSYVHWKMLNMYENVQNVVVKIGPKSTSNTTAYLLVNSHFDSVPGGPGAGDDGSMVAIMLEVLRVLLESKEPLKYPVVFLFNGAEENPLQASHGFITQHKCAKNIRAVINLDSAGSGGREILFQSGPNHPWLMNYYAKWVKHPYASTVAEELFQHNFIPSDTDFRIFRDYGKVPGLDMAYQSNGYVYHTRYDRSEIIPRGSLQNTGDNVLSLIRGLSQAPELNDTSKYAEGHTIFFDYLGILFIFYTETEGIILNVTVILAFLLTCTLSIIIMAKNLNMHWYKVLKRLMSTILVQLLALITGVALNLLIATLMDVWKISMAWFTNTWLIFGLYLCPLYFALAILPALHLLLRKKDLFPIGYQIQLQLHSFCIISILLILMLTLFKIRSAFLLTFMVMFYTIGLIVNLILRLHDKLLGWMIAHLICMIPPFLFYVYICHGFYVAFIPMTGRFGSNINPNLLIALFSTGAGILTGALIMPTLNLFHKSKSIISCLLIAALLCLVIAATPVGFPFRPETSVQRLSVLHTRRTFRDINNEIRKIETGYFILPMDRYFHLIKGHLMKNTAARSVKDDCETELLCGLPLYNHRWYKSRDTGIWIPGANPEFPNIPLLELTSKKFPSPDIIRYEMHLKGPDHMNLFIQPLNASKIHSWSFNPALLKKQSQPPYYIYYSYGKYSNGLNFWIDIQQNETEKANKKNLEIGISGHWNHHDDLHTDDFNKFLQLMPNYVDATAWPAYYTNWYF